MDSGILIFLSGLKRAVAVSVSLWARLHSCPPTAQLPGLPTPLQGCCLHGGGKHLSDVRLFHYTTCLCSILPGCTRSLSLSFFFSKRMERGGREAGRVTLGSRIKLKGRLGLRPSSPCRPVCLVKSCMWWDLHLLIKYVYPVVLYTCGGVKSVTSEQNCSVPA